MKFTNRVFGELWQAVKTKYEAYLQSQNQTVPSIKSAYYGSGNYEEDDTTLKAVLVAKAQQNDSLKDLLFGITIDGLYFYKRVKEYEEDKPFITIQRDYHYRPLFHFIGCEGIEDFLERCGGLYEWEKTEQRNLMTSKIPVDTNAKQKNIADIPLKDSIAPYLGIYESYITWSDGDIGQAKFEIYKEQKQGKVEYRVRGEDVQNVYTGSVILKYNNLIVNLIDEIHSQTLQIILLVERYKKIKVSVGVYACIGQNGDPLAGREIWIRSKTPYDELKVGGLGLNSPNYQKLDQHPYCKSIATYLTGLTGNRIESKWKPNPKQLVKAENLGKLYAQAAKFLEIHGFEHKAAKLRQKASLEGFENGTLFPNSINILKKYLLGIYQTYSTDESGNIMQSILFLQEDASVYYQTPYEDEEGLQGYAYIHTSNLYIQLYGHKVAQLVVYLGRIRQVQNLVGVYSSVTDHDAPVCGREILVKMPAETTLEEAQKTVKLLKEADLEEVEKRLPNLTKALLQRENSLVVSPPKANLKDFGELMG